MATKWITGKKWYYYLKNKADDDNSKIGLFDSCSELDSSGSLIVSTPNLDKRLYTMFPSYIEYQEYREKESEREFHEVICGTHRQKPRFDIDCNHSEIKGDPVAIGLQLLFALIKSIQKVLAEKDVKFNILHNLRVYESCGAEKESYHVIINGFYHNNSLEADAFAKIVIANTNHKYSNLIDSGIYSAGHSLRMLGCAKIGTARFKKCIDGFVYENKKLEFVPVEEYISKSHMNLAKLAESLVTFCNDSDELPSWYIKREYKDTEELELSDSTKSRALELMHYWDPSFEFNEDSSKDNFLALTRKESSYCKKCDRTHENENGFLIVQKNGNVRFYCGRSAEDIKYSVIGSVSVFEIEYVKNDKITEETKKKIKQNDKTKYARKFEENQFRETQKLKAVVRNEDSKLDTDEQNERKFIRHASKHHRSNHFSEVIGVKNKSVPKSVPIGNLSMTLSAARSRS